MYRNKILNPLKEKKNAPRKSVWLWIYWDVADFWKEELIHRTMNETV